jgi:hypothetical protein
MKTILLLIIKIKLVDEVFFPSYHFFNIIFSIAR